MHSAAPGSLSIKAPAKINLFLYVLDRKRDGYHRILSRMQTVGIWDRVSLRVVPGPRRVFLDVNPAESPGGRDNLVFRAAGLFLKHYGIRRGVRIRLEKQIPIAAGLGGGSSDAAATLRGLHRLFGIAPVESELMRLGLRLGSDVPFFLSAASALVEGTGETIRRVRPVDPAWAVLVNPGFPVSTAWAYRQWDRNRRERAVLPPPHVQKMGLTLAKRQNKINRDSRLAFQLKKLSPTLHNDLEECTRRAHPVIGIVKARLRVLGARGVLMSGSGPTVFGLFHQSRSANRAAAALRRDRRDWGVWAVRLLVRRSSLIRRSSNG